MQLTILNLTAESVVYRIFGEKDFQVQKSILGAKTMTLPKGGAQVALSRSDSNSDNFRHDGSKEGLTHAPGRAFIRVPLALSTRWKTISVPDESPWQVYLSRVSRLYFLA